MANNPILKQAANRRASPADITAALESTGVTAGSDKLAAVEDAMAAAGASAAENQASSRASLVRTEQLTDLISSTSIDAGKAAQVIALQRDTANLQAQNKTIEVADAGNVSTLQQSLMKELQQDVKDLSALRAKRDALDEDDKTNSILGTIANAFIRGGIDEGLTQARLRHQSTSNSLSSLTQATEQISAQNALTKKTLNQATIEANQKLIASNATIQATEAELKGLHTNSIARAQLAAADQRQIQNMLASARLENEVASIELQKEKTIFQRKSMVHSVEVWKEQDKQRAVSLEASEQAVKQAKLRGPTAQAQAEFNLAEDIKRQESRIQLENSFIGSVHRAQSSLNPDAPLGDRAFILDGIRRKDPAILKLLEVGSAADIRFGDTPAEAREFLGLMAASGQVAESGVTKMLIQVDSLVEHHLTVPAVDEKGRAKELPKRPRNKAEAAALYNTVAKNFAISSQSNIITGDTSNPYHAPPFAVLESSDDLRLHPLYNKVLVHKKMKETNPQVIVDAAVDGFLAGVVTIEEAVAGIESVFDLAALINNTQDGGFRRVALPSQTTYITTIKRAPTFGATARATVDPFATGFLPIVGIAKLITGTEAKVEGTQETVDLMDATSIRLMLSQLISTAPKPAKTPANKTEETK